MAQNKPKSIRNPTNEASPKSQSRALNLFTSSTATDWWIAFFTAVLAFVGIFQLTAMRGQLSAMTDQLDVMRKDQRAWISIEEKGVPTTSIGGPLSVVLSIKNTGKTPAAKIAGRAYIEIVPNGGNPHFESVYIAHTQWISGVILPNSVHERDVSRKRSVPDTNGLFTDDLLTEAEKSSIEDHRSWTAVHGVVEYEDVFKTKHWVRFCYPTVTGPGTFPFAACIAYNRVDDN